MQLPPMRSHLLALAASLLLSLPTAAEPLTDEQVFYKVQEASFRYFWDGAEPESGLARERIHLDGQYPSNDANTITTGGGGFGVMAILVGMERGFITREQGVERLERIAAFLERADRFHGAWPHWWEGASGKTKPFTPKDDGGDLVETAFMAQGLLCVRQYLADGSPRERTLAKRMDELWRGIDFNWYRNGQNVLYWHWSPKNAWTMNFPVYGFNECLVMYVLAAASPTHPVPPEVYHQGWAEAGKIKQPREALGHPLGLHHQGDATNGGPLFWAHYSFLGLDPRGLKDAYGDYGQECVSMARINHDWCVQNPGKFKGYGADNWGLTSSYSVKGYAAHSPNPGQDLGVIAPTAALSSFPYVPTEATSAMRHWHDDMADKLWGKYGFYDAFSETANWHPPHYLAIDQGPIPVMMENHRSQMLWKLFMSCPEVKSGLRKLGFQSPWLGKGYSAPTP